MDLRPLSAVFGVSVNQILVAIVRAELAVDEVIVDQGSSFPVQSSLLGEDRPDAFLSAQSGVRLLAATTLSQDTGRRTPLAAGAGFLVSGKPTQSADFERDLNDQ
jgi:hypothetical protein